MLISCITESSRMSHKVRSQCLLPHRKPPPFSLVKDVLHFVLGLFTGMHLISDGTRMVKAHLDYKRGGQLVTMKQPLSCHVLGWGKSEQRCRM